MPNKALHRMAIPLRSIVAGELCVRHSHATKAKHIFKE